MLFHEVKDGQLTEHHLPRWPCMPSYCCSRSFVRTVSVSTPSFLPYHFRQTRNCRFSNFVKSASSFMMSITSSVTPYHFHHRHGQSYPLVFFPYTHPHLWHLLMTCTLLHDHMFSAVTIIAQRVFNILIFVRALILK